MNKKNDQSFYIILRGKAVILIPKKNYNKNDITKEVRDIKRNI